MVYHYGTNVGWDLHKSDHADNRVHHSLRFYPPIYSGPPVLPGPARVSRFVRDRKRVPFDPLSFLWTCKQIKAEASLRWFASNDVVIPVWDMVGCEPEDPRYWARAGPAGLPALTSTLAKWLIKKKSPSLSIVLEIQESLWPNGLIEHFLVSLKRIVQQPCVSAVGFRLSVPLPVCVGTRGPTLLPLSAWNQGTQWIEPWRADVDIRNGRQSLRLALDHFRAQRHLLLERELVEPGFVEVAEAQLV